MNTRAIVVGYDGSVDSELAISWADDLASGQGRPLQVLISEVDPTQALEVTTDWHAARITELKVEARGRLVDSRTRDTSVEVVSAPPAAALIEASTRAAVVVIGARGHGLLSGVLLGSVSQHVARHASCPVVVTRQSNDPRADRVVVGIDGSTGSRQALEFAFDYASRRQLALTVIHAWRHRMYPSPGADLVAEIDAAERVLAESLAGFADTYPDVKVVSEAIPVAPQRALADASQGASLVVVGSRGLGAFGELLLGSVSHALLHHAQCPVAVVR